jgi:hypothetical protein
MRFVVLVKEVHTSHMEIHADSKEEAIEKVANGEGEEVHEEYSHTLDTDEWEVLTSES